MEQLARETLVDCSGTVQCYVLRDILEEQTYGGQPDARNTATDHLYSRHLFLLVQDGRPVAAMTTAEYRHRARRTCTRAHIQHLDTTGLYRPRDKQTLLTRSLVRTYLLYCERTLGARHVHLLAVAKPSLVFAGSEEMEDKRPLGGKRVVMAWQRMIGEAGFAGPARCFVYAPNQSHPWTERLRDKVRGWDGLDWRWGFPPELMETPVQDAPLWFEDDPKWMHYAAIAEIRSAGKRRRVHKDEESLAVFIESLGVRSEFRQDPAVFFVLGLECRERVLEDAPTSGQAQTVLKMLRSATFENEQRARTATRRILTWVAGFRIQPIVCSRQERAQPSPVRESSGDENSRPVASIQSLVRRLETQETAAPQADP